jgi:hypothetical protein
VTRKTAILCTAALVAATTAAAGSIQASLTGAPAFSVTLTNPSLKDTIYLNSIGSTASSAFLDVDSGVLILRGTDDGQVTAFDDLADIRFDVPVTGGAASAPDSAALLLMLATLAIVFAISSKKKGFARSGTRVACFLFGALMAAGQDNWVQPTPATSPSPRYGAVMAYDTLHQQVVLFGGEAIVGKFSEPVNDTWLWNGAAGTWTQASPVHSPPVRTYAQCAYDEARQQLVLFGGADSTGAYLADTWVWDGTDWTQESPSTKPPARYESAMVYDEIRQQVMMFGGSGPDLFADTWVWDGTNWTQKHPVNSPVDRDLPIMAYDVARQQTVLYGGSDSGVGTGIYGLLGDTWVWDGTNWTQKTPATNPPLGGGGALAYDSALQEVVLFGGFDANANDIPGTWVWNGITWAALNVSTNPPSRDSGSNQMAYDASQQQMVLFGGSSNSTGTLGDTWILARRRRSSP